jgi:hypothetical protein
MDFLINEIALHKAIKKVGESQTLVAHACNLATLKAEIRRVAVQSQPGQRVHQTLSKKKKKKHKKELVEWLKV